MWSVGSKEATVTQRTLACTALQLAVFSALAVSGIAQPASAQSYTHYTERRLNSSEYINYSDDPARATYGVLQDWSGTTLEYGWLGTNTWANWNGNDGYVIRQQTSDVYAKADLSSGELKARSIIEIGSNLPGSRANPAYGFSAATASASASFADTFRFAGTSGTPYLWGAGEQFQFHFAIDGETSLAAGQSAPTDSMQAGQSYARVSLKVYRAGEGLATIAAYSAHLDAMDWGNPDDVDRLYQLNDAILAATLGSHYWLLGDSLLPPSWYSGPNTTVVALDSNGAAMLDYSFAAGGDFEFVLSLDTQARVDLSYENMTNRIDFSNTLVAGFTAPEGVVVSSASGAFPGAVVAVPEPGTWLLWFAGLGLVMTSALRRSRKQ